MKYITIALLLLLLNPQDSICQGMSVTVARMKNGSAFIETTNISESSKINWDTKTGVPDITTSKSSYPGDDIWVGPQTLNTIQNGIKKAIDWAKKNEVHKMEFTKEIVRFRIMDKATYSFHKMYISEFSSEGKLLFDGYADGSFTLKFTVEFSGFQIQLTSVEDLQTFLGLLQGKSARKEVDDIFHTP